MWLETDNVAECGVARTSAVDMNNISIVMFTVFTVHSGRPGLYSIEKY